MHNRSDIDLAVWVLLPAFFLWGGLEADENENLPNDDTEIVELDGVSYDVPPPWKGRRISASADPAGLTRLPLHLAGQKSIYVTRATHDAFTAMASEARKAGVRLEVDSGFRSNRYQKQILERVLARGVPFDQAVRRIAPPGYSEHITGQAVDIVPSNGSFGDTEAYRWLRKNAGRFCFRETYPRSSSGDYPWEPWHWRFEQCRDQE